MSLRRPLSPLWVALAVSVFIVAQAPSPAQSRSLILATASTGGAYFPAGVAISALLNSRLTVSDNLVVTAINTTGSGENIHLLAEGECDLAILSGVYAIQAYRGMGFYTGRPMKNMAVVAMLWNNVLHVLLRNEFVKNGDLSDLKGLVDKFSLAALDSGGINSDQVIFDALGIIKDQDFIAEYMGFLPSVDAILKKQIGGAAFTAGVPIAAVSRLLASEGEQLSILNVTDRQLAKINADYDIWTRYPIKAWTYPGQNEDVRTIAYPNILVASNRLSDEDVYLITKCIFERLPQLAEFLETTNAEALVRALDGIDLPQHPGAQRYYHELAESFSQ
ncbi:TAXI family TRAP transporter solute-binding subunit [Pelobacter seleniigenes]|uniref:TAXI family TRAP transporter solute-binding subunit n=1 Tax=Pelobacter seleniigenes TaxID=407188 RepID=UPI0004A6E32A|nr:TAXI family TRAP transporter solute-binding subunit [Pelobacter seleniigenes]